MSFLVTAALWEFLHEGSVWRVSSWQQCMGSSHDDRPFSRDGSVGVFSRVRGVLATTVCVEFYLDGSVWRVFSWRQCITQCFPMTKVCGDFPHHGDVWRDFSWRQCERSSPEFRVYGDLGVSLTGKVRPVLCMCTCVRERLNLGQMRKKGVVKTLKKGLKSYWQWF